MKNIRNIFSVMTLAVVVGFGATFTNAGILINSRSVTTKTSTETPCSPKQDSGILINSLTGILINSLTGILINSAGQPPVDCGILINS